MLPRIEAGQALRPSFLGVLQDSSGRPGHAGTSPSPSPRSMYHPAVGRSGENWPTPGRHSIHHGVYGRRHETPSCRGPYLPRGSPEG